MIIVMKAGAAKKDKDEVLKRIRELGYKPHVIHGATRDVIGAVGDERGKHILHSMESMHGVESVVPILQPYKLASKEVKKERSIIRISDKVAIGGKELIVMAGPCSVEGEEQIIETALAVRDAGAQMLRGGAFKPRTSPYSFQGLEEEGLKLLAKAREASGLPFVTEVINPETVELVADYSDMLQIGARNAQNFALLKKVGQTNKPVLLKRGMSMTIQEFLMSAEYIMSEGNQAVILCERGIRTFETATRNTLDLSAIPVLMEKTHLPVVADPSHGTGNYHYVAAMAFAAVAAGADGLMIEVHSDPEHASSDGPQSLKPSKFAKMMGKLKLFAEAADRTL
ncbi:MAG: 3-deoxy-7-phosphoheptulonate synthase [Deltaproteobacteria bacterium]|nr:3-deoxy-7-phosphoheptulonate synthase [Deltaproteobacteria bacterium]TLN01480.1 MAG: 3-deoxy-7-phosphoheptulonate synthase [bacterium]